MSREDYEASEDDNQLVTGVVRRRGRLRLLRLLLLRGRGGPAQPGRRRQRRRQLRQAVRRDDPGRLLQAALPPAVHVPEREGDRRVPRSRRSWTSSSTTRPAIAEAAKIVPLTDEQADDGQGGRSRPPRAARSASDSVADYTDSRLRRRDGAPDQPGPAPLAAVRASRARSRRSSSARRSSRSLTTLAIVFSLLSETIAFFGDVPIGDFLFGTKWTPQFAGDQQSFGVLPLVWGTLYLTGIGLLVADPGRDPLAAIYLAEFAPRAGAQGRSSRCSRCSPACRRSSSATSP